MARPLKRIATHVMEEECLLAFRNILPPKWVFRKQNPDYGIDAVIEIVEGENITNKVLWVQLKSTDKAKHSRGVIPYTIETKYVQHFLECRLPVALVLWVSSEKLFYCLFAQKYLQQELSVKHPNWKNQKTVTIEFPLNSRLENADQLKEIATEGYFYILQQQLFMKTGGTTTYWLDGIPISDDDELKERMLKALECLRWEKHAEAIEHLEDILRVCTISPTERMSVLLNLGIAYYLIGQSQVAFRNFNAVLSLVQKAKIIEALLAKPAALGNIGLVFLRQGNLFQGIRYFQSALKLYREIGHKQGETATLGNIGLVYLQKGDLDSALEYYKAALKIDKEMGHKFGESSDLGSIGLIYIREGDLDAGLENFQSALKIYKEKGYKQGEAIALGNIGSVYLYKDDLDKALDSLNAALNILNDSGLSSGRDKILTTINLVKAKLDTKQNRK